MTLSTLTPQPATNLPTRWGTITAINPLQVRLDGESAIVPVQQSLAPVRVGDRVMMLLAGQMLIVLGVAHGTAQVAEEPVDPGPPVGAVNQYLYTNDGARVPSNFANLYWRTTNRAEIPDNRQNGEYVKGLPVGRYLVILEARFNGEGELALTVDKGDRFGPFYSGRGANVSLSAVVGVMADTGIGARVIGGAGSTYRGNFSMWVVKLA